MQARPDPARTDLAPSASAWGASLLPDDAAVLVDSSADNRIRWPEGTRFEQLWEARCDRFAAEGSADFPAVEEPDGRTVGYAELDAKANRLARFLQREGFQAGNRVAILLPGGTDAYTATLAVLKAGGVFVPLDPGFPADRIAYILADAEVRFVLTASTFLDRFPGGDIHVTEMDGEAAAISDESAERLTGEERSLVPDDLAYLIYTSGTTGRPKGVQIDHRAFCNFVSVAVETYGLPAQARMYQGLSLAFDFSVEEIWVPLLAGATLIPGSGGLNLVGHDLGLFLAERNVSALCCVPTLLATIDMDLPAIRFLLVSGEACPADLVARWFQPGRTFLNAYGPTEATVTATLSRPEPDRPVTIGVPLPTYTVVILDPERDAVLVRGERGEIALAGVGLSRGYLNRDDLTARAFVPDFLDLPDNPTGKLYRTGDLGRINASGEVEYAGRIDTQVKIRGYRIELTEIESVLMEEPAIAQAVVEKWESAPGRFDLVAYYTLRDGAEEPENLVADLRLRLPSYMVPSFFEPLPAIPMLVSNKADRKSLPPPRTMRRGISDAPYEPPSSATESLVAGAVATVLGLEQVSVADHLFDDLGANSLGIAQVCAILRQNLPGAPVSMKDVYLNPSVRALSARLDATAAAPVRHEETLAPHKAGTAAYLLCGAGQALAYFGMLWFYAFLSTEGLLWIDGAASLPQLYARAVAAASAALVLLCLLPVALKWLLVGRWKADAFPIWGLRYFRFWLVKTAIRTSPIRLFVGTPLYAFMLRLLGARIGRNVSIFAAQIPVCTDLLFIGDDAVIRKDAVFSGFHAESGRIETGPVRIGAGATVGESAVLDIGTELGAGAQLAPVSSLQKGMRVPDGLAHHGSPAVPAGKADYRLHGPLHQPDAVRRFLFGLAHLVVLVGFSFPLVAMLIVLAHRESLGGGTDGMLELLAHPVPASLMTYFGAILVGLVLIATLPRLGTLVLRESTVYPLYGFRYAVLRWISASTNSPVYNILFGDSSFILYYLRWIGWRVDLTQQTGTNFGLVQRHDSPYACTVGSGTLVSDGLTFVNAEYSHAAFRVAPARIGADNFLGNGVVFPAGARTGDNCLLATKVMVPTDGPMRENVGLLGSPAFAIPRSVQRDKGFAALKAPGVFKERLRAKNRSNLLTIGLYLTTRWLLFLAAWTVGFEVYGHFEQHGSLAAALGLLALTVLTTVYFILVERLLLGFGRMTPKFCSIYDPYFWTHERYWKVADTFFVGLTNGTPFKGLVWRLLGVRVGKKLYDGGASLTERTLVEIGDHCTLSELCTLQSHSLEDGAFKSGVVRLGDGCTVGTKAYVSYSTTLDDGAILDPDSFLMKGEIVAADTRWRGNPAREFRR